VIFEGHSRNQVSADEKDMVIRLRCHLVAVCVETQWFHLQMQDCDHVTSETRPRTCRSIQMARWLLDVDDSISLNDSHLAQTS
jgi:hypothetical protein